MLNILCKNRYLILVSQVIVIGWSKYSCLLLKIHGHIASLISRHIPINLPFLLLMAFDVLPLGSVSFRSQMSMGRKYEDQKKE